MPSDAIRMKAKTRLAKVLIWFIPLLWTVNMVVARQAPGVVSPHVLALGRWGLAGLILAAASHRELWKHRFVLRQHAWRYIALGACGMWICGAWVYLAGQSTVAMNISLIYASAPVMIAVGSVLWLGERFSKRQVLGVVLAMSGVVHVVVRGEWVHLSQVQLVEGDAWIFAAAIAWAAYALLQKRWPTVLGSTAQLAAICAGGVLVLLPFALWELCQASTPVVGETALWMMLFTALLPGVGAYWIYGWTQKILGASRVAMTLYLGPLYTAVTAWMVLAEPLGWHHLMGGAMILSGVGMVIAAKSSKTQA
ncbi:EamA family transporter [Limnohabitans sp. Jir61]|uniref:DMT family transporter n=1 Tax=Limnohabitans sp. Jir61 TaxID=1826168 RepID=UPI000D36BE52|nr:DMT family transporter [Limnohabitans sp. Jir61]PUE32737.1 EamA family transporter [Limnohabitans sp. Jir61]